MNHIAVPRNVFAKYWPMSWTDIHAAAERGDDELADAVEKDRAIWEAIPDKNPAWKYSYGFAAGTYNRLAGYAVLRDGSKDLRRDGACLFMQCW